MSESVPNTANIAEAATSTSVVPATVGVIKRRRSDRRAVNINWNTVETMISDDISAGPPSSSAVAQIRMKAEDGPVVSV